MKMLQTCASLINEELVFSCVLFRVPKEESHGLILRGEQKIDSNELQSVCNKKYIHMSNLETFISQSCVLMMVFVWSFFRSVFVFKAMMQHQM